MKTLLYILTLSIFSTTLWTSSLEASQVLSPSIKEEEKHKLITLQLLFDLSNPTFSDENLEELENKYNEIWSNTDERKFFSTDRGNSFLAHTDCLLLDNIFQRLEQQKPLEICDYYKDKITSSHDMFNSIGKSPNKLDILLNYALFYTYVTKSKYEKSNDELVDDLMIPLNDFFLELSPFFPESASKPTLNELHGMFLSTIETFTPDINNFFMDLQEGLHKMDLGKVKYLMKQDNLSAENIFENLENKCMTVKKNLVQYIVFLMMYFEPYLIEIKNSFVPKIDLKEQRPKKTIDKIAKKAKKKTKINITNSQNIEKKKAPRGKKGKKRNKKNRTTSIKKSTLPKADQKNKLISLKLLFDSSNPTSSNENLEELEKKYNKIWSRTSKQKFFSTDRGNSFLAHTDCRLSGHVFQRLEQQKPLEFCNFYKNNITILQSMFNSIENEAEKFETLLNFALFYTYVTKSKYERSNDELVDDLMIPLNDFFLELTPFFPENASSLTLNELHGMFLSTIESFTPDIDNFFMDLQCDFETINLIATNDLIKKQNLSFGNIFEDWEDDTSNIQDVLSQYTIFLMVYFDPYLREMKNFNYEGVKISPPNQTTEEMVSEIIIPRQILPMRSIIEKDHDQITPEILTSDEDFNIDFKKSLIQQEGRTSTTFKILKDKGLITTSYAKFLKGPSKYNAEDHSAALYRMSHYGDQYSLEAKTLYKTIIADPDSSEVNLTEAQYRLAEMYRLGQGGDQDLIEARSLYEKLIHNMYLSPSKRYNANFQLTCIYIDNESGDKDLNKERGVYEAVIKNTKSSDEILAKVQYRVAEMYRFGEGGDKDFDKASSLYEKLINNTHLSKLQQHNAQYYLAEIYRLGEDGYENLYMSRILYEMLLKNPDIEVNLTEAQYQLARMYRLGEGGDKNLEEARVLFEAVIDHQDLNILEQYYAKHHLAYMYLAGQGGDKNPDKARFLYETVIQDPDISDDNLGEVQYRLAKMYLIGQGGDKNLEEARVLFKAVIENTISSDARIAEAQYQLAEMYLIGQGGDENFEEARSLFEKVIDNPNLSDAQVAEVQYQLAEMYRWGKGGDKKLEKARSLFEKVEATPNIDEQYIFKAQYHLAYMYITGQGGDKFPDKARSLYEMVTKNPSLSDKTLGEVQYELAVMYRWGQGGDKKLEEARALFEEVIDNPNLTKEKVAEAQYHLAYMYITGQGGDKFPNKARVLFEAVIENTISSDARIAEVQYQLAKMYRLGQGGDKKLEEARALFEAVINHQGLNVVEQYNAKHHLAYMYLSGEGGDKNPDKARSLYETVMEDPDISEANLAEVQYQLAELYWNGQDRDTNLEKARVLFKAVIENSKSSYMKKLKAQNRLNE